MAFASFRIVVFVLQDLVSGGRKDARQRRRSIAISQIKSNPATDFKGDDATSSRLGRKPSFSLLRVVPNIVMASKGMMKHISVDANINDDSEKSDT